LNIDIDNIHIIINNLSSYGLRIGLSGRDFRLEGQWVGEDGTDSFAVHSDGYYWASGKKQEKDAPQGFGLGDVIGCGLVVMPTGSRHIFFTKNGENWGMLCKFASV
jgi:hypothetical protein